MAPLCNAALCRRDDPENTHLRMIVFASYLIAFVVATAIVTYILACIQPPKKWKWYCCLRGRPVEPCSPHPACPTNDTLAVDDGLNNGSADRRTGGLWMRGAIAKFLRRQPNGRYNGGAMPDNRIRCTAAYVVRHELALELQPSTSKPATTTTNAWPLANNRQNSTAELRYYSGGN